MKFPTSLLPAMNLRAKILIALGCYIAGILVMSYIAQKELVTAREKLTTLELAYNLDSRILEIRRYEKNYLLYDTQDALQHNQDQIKLALETTYEISIKARRFKAFPVLLNIKDNLLLYQDQMAQLVLSHEQKNDQNKSEITEKLRLAGQELNELSKKLVSVEHTQITTIIQEQIQQHHLWSFIAILVGSFVPFILFFKVFKPLKIIKLATQDIAKGQFSTIEVVNTNDEMHRVMVAFNTMVKELQTRQDQLVQSQKLSSIGTLSAGIAHQLNNPLNNIYTSCQIAIDEFDTDDRKFIRQMLRNIDQETIRARDVVQGLLEFSREKEFALRTENLLNVVNKAVSLVQSQVPASITLSVDVPEELNLPLDSQRLQEVFLNLIINASQAITDFGSITISAGTENEHVVINISDTGAGIPPEIVDRLFDPFFSTKEEGQGTGLGLSIAYGIIQKHNGEITVKSELDQGTTFTIKLPLHREGQSGQEMS